MPQFKGGCATHEPAAHAIGALLHAHRTDGRQYARVAFGNQRGQHFVGQQRPLAVFHCARAGKEVRFTRKGGQQPLRESVDGIDPQAAARAIENTGEKRARAGAGFGRDRRADMGEFAAQIAVLQPHPAG